MKKLALSTPSSELVDAYLFEIAKGYGVNWSPPTSLAKEGGNAAPNRKRLKGMQRCAPFRSHPFHFLIYANTINEGRGEKGKEVLDNVKAKVEADVKVPKLPDMPPTEGSEPKTKEKKWMNLKLWPNDLKR
jgi:hypothetical protein